MNGWATNPENSSEKIICEYTNPSNSQLLQMDKFKYQAGYTDYMYTYNDGYWQLANGTIWYMNPFSNDPSLMSSHSTIHGDLFDSIASSLPKAKSTLLSQNGLDPDYRYFISMGSNGSVMPQTDANGNTYVDVNYSVYIYSRPPAAAGSSAHNSYNRSTYNLRERIVYPQQSGSTQLQFAGLYISTTASESVSQSYDYYNNE